ncbi:hypothetical protein JCM24511_08634 [Saitozyma sp. JCM 24511]|nr:hypothetical protein JCM24511_08634 [Saitozyma sp. JCM 24511]
MAASTWDIVSSALFLAIFLGVVLAAYKLTSAVSASTASTQANMRSKGVTYESGRLSVRTDRAAPSRDEYIASTQRAFERGAKQMSLHPDAFKTGPSRDSSAEPDKAASAAATGNGQVGKSSAVETP